MLRRTLLAAALVLAARPLAAQAPADTAAVVAAAQRLLDAINTRDTALARRTMMPGGQLVSLRGDTVVARVRVQRDSAFVGQLAAPAAERLLERMWAPTVLLQDPIATVWAPYDFHVNGKWSHCGVDVFSLVKVAGEWRVAGITYTVQRRDCRPSPLGPPPA